MKKKIAMLLTTVMAISMLGGCGKEAANSLKDLKVEEYVTLGEYKELAVTVDAASVDATEQAQMVSEIYNNYVTAEAGGILDRAVEDGDTVNIDYVGKKDDVAFDGGTAEGALLTIGSGQYIDGFESGLVGVMPGETVDLNLTFPEDYGNTELAGAAVVFTVTVNFILPTEMKDEVVAAFGQEDYSNVEELNQYVYDYLYETSMLTYDSTVQNAVLEAFLASCTFEEEMPEFLVEQYSNNMRKNFDTAAAGMGIDADTYCGYFYGMDVESFISQYAVESVKQSVAYQAVANAENLNLNDEALDAMLEEYAVENGFANAAEMIGDNPKEDYREYFTMEKVMDYLVENAVVTEN